MKLASAFSPDRTVEITT